MEDGRDIEFDPYVDLYLAAPLTEAAGSISFVGRGADACDGTCFGINSDRTHTLTGASVPEPGASVLLGTILAFLGVTLRRRMVAR